MLARAKAYGMVGFAVGLLALSCATTPAPPPAGPTPAPSEPAAPSTEPSAETPAITLRNISQEPIHYSVRTGTTDDEFEQRVLVPGAMDRFETDEPITVRFDNDGEVQSYGLDPGRPYLFRMGDAGPELYQGSHGRADAADLGTFVPTPDTVVNKMLGFADLDSEDVLYDLGCGDGRIVIAAASKYGSRGVGIELDPKLVAQAKQLAQAAGVARLVEFRRQDVTKADFSKATVVTLYLLPESNLLLRPLLEKQLAPGTIVISHDYAMPGWEKRLVDSTTMLVDGKMHGIMVYRR